MCSGCVPVVSSTRGCLPTAPFPPPTPSQLNPQPPAEVALGLAYCYAKLDQPALARRAMERTLELAPDCVGAMVGIAVSLLNEDKVAEALTMLKRAYELDPYNASVLNHLADHYFNKGDFAKAEKLARRAHDSSDHHAAKAIVAQSCYHIARCHHAQENYAGALQFYKESVQNNPSYLAPQFGLGQMHLANKDLVKAAACFEKVLKASPDNVNALKALGHLYTKMDKDGKELGGAGKEGREAAALQKLQKATELEPTDVAAWIELAKLQQKMGFAKLPAALKAYEKAAGQLRKSGGHATAQLWNNIGALRHRLGKLDSAEQAYGRRPLWSSRTSARLTPSFGGFGLGGRAHPTGTATPSGSPS